MRKGFVVFFRVFLAALVIASLVYSLVPVQTAKADAVLTIEAITWDVIGLDSNRPASGPRHFPVGARVCNVGSDPTNDPLTVTFEWDDENDDDYINIRPGTNEALTFSALAAGGCVDAYFEVEVQGVPAAYRTTRGYTITGTDGSVSATTPSPRELYVEYLISQNRNATTDIKFGTESSALTSVGPGGSMNLLVGGTYYIQLDAKTATQGYEQLETFITLSNTVFQILSVETTYSANTSPYVSNPHDQLYADACLWENDPNSPNYLACLDSGKKSGGTISVLYQVYILGGGGTTQSLNSLIYDFSGASFHYNSDYSVGARFANIIDPATNVGFSKRFIPSTIGADGVAALSFTITNPNPVSASGYNFVDNLPGNMTVADPANASNTCGGSITANAGEDVISFTDGVIGPNGSCTVLVGVTVPFDVGATYPLTLNNVSANLFVGDVDTGGSAAATLSVTAAPPPPLLCTPVAAGTVVAKWTSFDSAFNPNHPPTTPGAGEYDLGVGTAAGAGLSTSVNTNRWTASNVPSGETLANSRTNNRYFEFVVNTTGLDDVSLSFQVSRQNGNGPASVTLDYGPQDSFTLNTQTWPGVSTNAGSPSTFPVSNLTNLSPDGNTYFRFYVYDATNANIEIRIHNMTFTGSGIICTPIDPGDEPDPPSISKAFSPDEVRIGVVSKLTFTLTNPNTDDSLTGVTFSDELPDGMKVASPPNPGSTCTGTWAPAADDTILNFTEGTLAANSSCTLTVDVISTTVGANLNLSDPIDATETYAGNSASATLTVLPPPTDPSIFKQFDPNPLLDPAGSTTLTFRITNTDPTLDIEDVAFTDPLPNGIQPVGPFSYTDNSLCGGSYSFTWDNGTNELSFSGGVISAGEACEIYVEVEVPGASISDSFFNQTSTVSHMFNGITYQGNHAETTLLVDSPNPAIILLKQVGLTGDPDGAWFSFLSVTEGADVYYKFTVENTGDVQLTSVNVTDPNINLALCSWTDGDGDPLAAPFTLPVADTDVDDHIAICILGPFTAAAGSNDNTATATGTYGGNDYTDIATATYATVGLTLDKSSVQGYFTSEGNTINYNYVVENTGDAPLLGPVTVTDDKAAVSCPPVNTVGDNDNYLDPGESLTCTASYTVTAGDVTAGSVTNLATASVDGVDSNSDTVTVPHQLPDLSVTKTNDTGGSGIVSAPFTWTLTVANTGTLDATFADGQTLLSDPLPAGATYGAPVAGNDTNITGFGNISCSIDGGNLLTCVANGGDVTIGAATGSFTVSIPVTPTAGGNLSNIATVDPNDNVTESNEANNTGTDSVAVFDAAPVKAIAATSEPSTTFVGSTERVAIGEMVRYRISAQLPEGSFTNVQFVDNIPNGLQFLDDGTTTVAFVCTNTGSDCITSSTLSGVGLLITGNSPSVTPTLTLPDGAISGGPFGSGTDVTFSLGDLVNSDGDSDLEYVVVEFNALVLNVNSGMTINQGVDNDPNSGTAGQSNSNNRQNSATLRVDGSTVGSASPNVTVAIAEPAITDLAKSVSAGPYLPGNAVTYTLTFSNTATGNNATTAFDIVLTDTLDTNLTPGTVDISSTQGTSGVDTCAGGTTFTASSGMVGQTVTVNVSCLDPGESVTVTIDTTIDGNVGSVDIDNSASLTYTSLPGEQGSCAAAPFSCANLGGSGSGSGERNGSGGPGADGTVLNNYADVSETISFTVTGTPVLNVTKSETSSGPYGLGDTITYDIVAENTGDTTLTNVTVSDLDATVGVCTPAQPSTLTPGETMTCPASYVVTQADVNAGSFTNTATSNSDQTDPSTDDETVNIAQNPALNVTKSETSSGPYGLGDTITYEIVVENTGDVTLTNVTVSDPDATVGVCTPANGSDLAPDATMTCPASYVVTQADVNAGSFTNTASADSDQTDPSTDDETVNIAQNPALIIIKEVSDDNATWTDSVNVAVGDTVYYRITVENTGNVPLTNVVVDDGMAGCALSGPVGDTNTNNILDVTEIWVYTCSVTAVVGTQMNNASASSDEVTTPEEDDAEYIGISADLSLVKTVNNPSPTVGDNVTFTITVTNNGPSDATGVAVNDLLPAGLAYVSDNSASTGTTYNSGTGIWSIGDLNFNDSISLQITATVVDAGVITNTAVAIGNEVDPDPDNNEGSAEIGGVFDPPFARKTFNDLGLPELEFRMVWINSGNAFAIDVQVTDNIPTGTTYVSDSITCEPRGSSSNAATATSPLSVTAIPNSFCGFDAGNNRIQWQGTIGPDAGVANDDNAEANANNEVVITFRVTVNGGVNQVLNQGFSRTDVDADGDFDEETVLGTSLVGSNQVIWNRSASGGGTDPVVVLPRTLPATGFAPGLTSVLPEQPSSKAYAATDVWLEIPALGVRMPIVGVPLVDGDWDVSWLGNQAGWLNGTAFPSWKGNSALTGHVALPEGQPGPFANLGNLKWGDSVVIHAYGYVYVYQVRENRMVAPNETSVLKHEQDAWLTLITCKNYNEAASVYANRVSVRAVLISVQKEQVKTMPHKTR